MNIKEIKSGQVILFPHDEIPHSKLLVRANAEKLSKKFQFSQAEVGEVAPDRTALLLAKGLFAFDGDEVTIEFVGIEERRLLFNVEGPTEAGNALLEELRSAIRESVGLDEGALDEPILVAHDSTVIGTLDVPFENLVSPGLLDFLETQLTEAGSTDKLEALPKFGGIAINLDYEIIDDQLHDYRITPSRKNFRLEPRKGYPLADQMYFSSAPIPSQAHLELLEELEELLG